MRRERKRTAVVPRMKLWLSSAEAEGIFGDGKWRLLGAVEQQGSLSAAAAALKMSYRKAWGDLRKAEACLKIALIEKHRGGRAGGKTDLTDAGKKWLSAYSRFRSDAEKAVARAYEKHIRSLLRQ
ncbi:MAG: LysR family transcriptional regulator [Planctomycetota bacterium]